MVPKHVIRATRATNCAFNQPWGKPELEIAIAECRSANEKTIVIDNHILSRLHPDGVGTRL